MKLLFAIAILPAVLLFRYVNGRDRLEAEPKGLRTRLAVFGALSVLPALIIELIGEQLTARIADPILCLMADDLIVVAFAEEGCKYAVMRLTTWNSREFNCAYDGLLYAVYVSLGFALIENIIFVFTSGFATGLLRAFTAVPGHCFYGVLMGMMYTYAKRADLEHDVAKRKRYGVYALLLPALVHGLYDLLIEFDTTVSVALFFVMLVLIYVLGIKMINRASKNDFFFATGTIIPPEPDQANDPDKNE